MRISTHSASASIAGGLVIGIGVFILTAVIESFITVYMFKKFGGCPLAGHTNKEKHDKEIHTHASAEGQA